MSTDKTLKYIGTISYKDLHNQYSQDHPRPAAPSLKHSYSSAYTSCRILKPDQQ